MGAVQQARQQLVDAMAEGIYNVAASGWDRRGALVKWKHLEGITKTQYLDKAEAALTVVETLRTKCGNAACENGQIRKADSLHSMDPDFDVFEVCKTCGGTGLGSLAILIALGGTTDQGEWYFPSARPTETKP